MPKFLNQRYIRSLYGAGYSRDLPALERQFQLRASYIESLISPTDRVLVVGAGFGGLIRHLGDLGVEAWGLEPGEFYWEADPYEWEGVNTVANDWCGSHTAKASLTQIGAGGLALFDWVIDEDCSTMHEDDELDDLMVDLEAFVRGNDKSKVLHIVTPYLGGKYGDSAVNWKTMDEWWLVAPTHKWVSDSEIREWAQS